MGVQIIPCEEAILWERTCRPTCQLAYHYLEIANAFVCWCGGSITRGGWLHSSPWGWWGWRTRFNHLCAVAMQPFVRLLWPLVKSFSFKSKLGYILGTTLVQKVSLRFFGGTAGGGGFTTTDSGPTGWLVDGWGIVGFAGWDGPTPLLSCFGGWTQMQPIVCQHTTTQTYLTNRPSSHSSKAANVWTS